MISLSINNEFIEVSDGTTVLEAAKLLNYKIPTLCYQPNLSIYGGCRICVVEIEGYPILMPACATEVMEGMNIQTNSEKVQKARKSIFELIIANHPFDCSLNCLTCSKMTSCELQEIAAIVGLNEINYEPVLKEWDIDTSSKSIIRENSKCIACGRCVRTCEEIQHTAVLTLTNRGPATKVGTFLEKGMGNVECTNCGQCVISCPTGAIREVYAVNKVISAIQDPTKHVVVQTAPAVRITLGEEFGIAPGTNTEGKMVTALKKMGFDKVFDTNFTADLTILEEGSEFIKRFKENKNLPLITSCSPGWVKFAEDHLPEILDNLSTCKSPQQMFGALSKSYYAQKANIDPKNIISVSIMPCTAKKFECAREEMNSTGQQDVDFGLTTRELARLIKSYGIEYTELEDSKYDDPFGISTGAAAIFGVTGGVMEAALRTAYEIITNKDLPEINLHSVRGLEGIREAVINIEGTNIKVAVANGLENAFQLLKNKDKYHFIEVMACPGGCIGGGGQPISRDEKIIEKRCHGIYATDKSREHRKSHKNPSIIKLYEEFLGSPLSEISHKYLHTHYKKRTY